MTLQERFDYLANKYHYSEEHYLEKKDFIESECTHTEGPKVGKPLILSPFHCEEFLKPAFGLFLDSSCRKRLIRKVYIQMPRGNAKTTVLSAIQITLLFNDGERNAQIYNCAGDDDQAGILFNACQTMILQNPELLELVGEKNIQRSYIRFSREGDRRYIKKITSKSSTKHGLKPHGWTYDEIHGAKHRDLYDTLSTAMGKRLNPMGWIITTPGTDKGSICYQLYEYTLKINSGQITDDRFWGVIYGAEKNDDIYSLDTIKKANPLYNYSETLRDDLESELITVKNDPTYENTFKRLRLGMWTSSINRFVPSDKWLGCETDKKIKKYKGEECFLGFYLDKRSDLTSLAVYFPVKNIIFCYFWIPEMKIKEYENDVPFLQWADNGYVDIIPGNLMEPDPIKERLFSIQDKYRVVKMAIEKDAAHIIGGVLADLYFEKRQVSNSGYQMNAATNEFHDMVVNESLNHDGNRVLSWMMDNVNIKRNEAGKVKMIRKEDSKNISGPIAITLAIDEYLEDAKTRSEYQYEPIYEVNL